MSAQYWGTIPDWKPTLLFHFSLPLSAVRRPAEFHFQNITVNTNGGSVLAGMLLCYLPGYTPLKGCVPADPPLGFSCDCKVFHSCGA